MFLQATFGYPSYLEDGKAYDIVHDADGSQVIMGSTVDIQNGGDYSMTVHEPFIMTPTTNQYLFFVAAQDSNSHVVRSSNGLTSYTPTSPGTYYAGIIGANYWYGR